MSYMRILCIVRSMFHMTILIKLVFRTFLYYFINWNYLVCDSVLLSQTEWVISTYCWLGRSALSDIRASPQLGHLAQDAAHCGDRYAVSATPLRCLWHRSPAPYISAWRSDSFSFSSFCRSSSIVVLCSVHSSAVLRVSLLILTVLDCLIVEDTWLDLDLVSLFICRIRSFSTQTSRHFACNEPNPEMSLLTS